jgi:hypothetical protein
VNTISGIMMATQAFHLGFQNNQIIHRMNHIISSGIQSQEKITEMVKMSQTMLKIIQTTATLFSDSA